MTCGMLCVMRRERRGVLHLDKYSPPKANLFGGGGGGGGGWGGEERKREKGKERRKIMERKENQQFSNKQREELQL